MNVTYDDLAAYASGTASIEELECRNGPISPKDRELFETVRAVCIVQNGNVIAPVTPDDIRYLFS
jgi:hypothetical protein